MEQGLFNKNTQNLNAFALVVFSDFFLLDGVIFSGVTV